jgi:hypothetical protein
LGPSQDLIGETHVPAHHDLEASGFSNRGEVGQEEAKGSLRGPERAQERRNSDARTVSQAFRVKGMHTMFQ